MKMNKRIQTVLGSILGVTFLFSNALSVGAHPAKQNNVLKSEYHSVYGGYYVGGESVGWSIDENNHNGSPYLYYTWKSGDACLTAARKNNFIAAAAKWSPCGNISYDPSGGGNTYQAGKLGTFNPGPGSGTVAQFYGYSSDAQGHLYYWKIDMNWTKSYSNADWAEILAHEFGHAFGLNDLYNSSNSNKLMYGYTNGTATRPTATDIKGFNVITGKHTTHSFNTSGVCTGCGGLKK